ncbi:MULTISPECIES: VPS10 domain-containing protein [Cellulophaga]|uniref:VPS10 domain-containing protein n=1 Tax=Cellulophaga TaxID=104264 RepID=UPI000B5CF06F|nr:MULTISPECIES: glycosyl hydrolase [Cellulophaga]MDO6489920.1 glycosyl hydrolase [Cellulophaga sp. 2_MG-2023]MDO6494886.1 glycosyl hydrolase [Cellulophaga sp. 3_MG-2023]SNQ42525.1 Glycosyl hydrolase BNR repeat-containing protein [Cellulophaga lytica]
MKLNHLKNSTFLLLLLCISQISFAQKRKQKSTTDQYPEALYSSMQYRLIGPFRGGRSAAVTGVPNKPNLFYFGATGGGVWKTEDGGRSWGNISDGFFGGSIGAIEVAQSDPNIIYVGGGEKTLRGNVSSGYGIWKTEDGGKTWTSAGLSKSRHIPRIKIHPKNPNIIYAAVLGNIYKPTEERGVYKSTDGGKTWRKTLFVNSSAGAVDLTLDPNNPRVLYASTWRAKRTPYSLSSGGDGSALWKSTDSGETWTEISKNEGFPKDTLGIIGVTVSPKNSERVWAIVENKEKGGLYRSDDGGKKWTQVNAERKLRQRAWYYTRLYADTEDVNTVYVLNVQYHKSTDGGKTFSTFNAPHGDHHDLWIAPENPKRMIIGDDGGAQITYDGGDTWSTYNNQPTAQFYRVTTDNAFPYRIYAAQQDNSTIRINHRSDGRSISDNDWEETAGGESAHIAVDPTNNDIVYGGSYGGFLTRKNHKTGTTRAINVWPDNPMGYGADGMKYRFQWNFPILFSKHNPKKLYTFSNHVHVTENEGQSWKLLSDDLTRNDPSKLVSSGGPITQDNTSVEYYCTIFAANESPLKEGLLWVGSDDGLIHVSKNGGETWENVTPKNMPQWSMVNSIEPSAFNEGTCYVAATKYKLGDFAPYLYKTTDYGQTWTKITNGINNEHFTRVVREDPKQKGLLYAGTETGMYISFNDGASWKPFQLNLPIVPITDLTIKNNNLIVATQGRSLWILDDLSVLHQLDENTKNATSILYKPKDTYRTKGGSSSRPSKLAGSNHPNGVITHFYINKLEENDNVKLIYFNKKGDTLATFSNKAKEKNKKLKVKKGGNTFVWDTRGKGAEKLKGMIFWWASFNGPKAVPGDYNVQLVVNGATQSKDFTIVPDPRAEASIADMQKQYNFITEVNETVNKAHTSIKKMRKITAQLSAFEKQYKDTEATKELVEKAKTMREKLENIEKELYQTKNRSNQDPLNFPIKLTNKLAHINSLIGLDDFAPTDQDIAVKNELTAKINTQLTAFNKVLDDEITAFNTAFNNLKLNYLFVEE